jgi:hypothetical protein
MLEQEMKSSAQRRLQRRRAFDRHQAALTAAQARGAAESLAPGSQGERGQGVPQDTAQPFTRSQLRDIRTGLHRGADLEAIANQLQFHPLLLSNIPNTVGEMVLDKELLPRDRVAAAKTFAAFITQRMRQEERDLQIGEYDTSVPAPPPPLDGDSVEIIQTLLVAVRDYPEARAAVVDRLRLTAQELREQAAGGINQPAES